MAQHLLDPLPTLVLDHHEPAAPLGQVRPQATDQPVILRGSPPIRALVLNGQNRTRLVCAARQLTQKIRVEAPVGFLQEEGTAFASDKIAHPELDTTLLCLNVQPAGALEFFLAVEIAEAAVAQSATRPRRPVCWRG